MWSSTKLSLYSCYGGYLKSCVLVALDYVPKLMNTSWMQKQPKFFVFIYRFARSHCYWRVNKKTGGKSSRWAQMHGTFMNMRRCVLLVGVNRKPRVCYVNVVKWHKTRFMCVNAYCRCCQHYCHCRVLVMVRDRTATEMDTHAQAHIKCLTKYQQTKNQSRRKIADLIVWPSQWIVLPLVWDLFSWAIFIFATILYDLR